jgi:hypothetical protein
LLVARRFVQIQTHSVILIERVEEAQEEVVVVASRVPIWTWMSHVNEMLKVY